MKKNNLYIFTEGGDGIGFGHITRCSALYEKALEQNLNPKFIVFGKNIEETLKQYNHEIREWKDIDYLSTLITKEDFVIVDSYLASIEMYQKISNLSKKSLYIDDNMRLDYPSGIVVNPSLYGDELNYPLKKDVKYLLGKDYIILRKEFENIQKKEKNKDKEIRKILITLGGTDIKNLTPKILKILKNINSEYQVRVVIGSSFDNINEILLEKTSNIELLYNLTAFQMLNEMKNSDLVISACGQTIYELLVVGTPFIPIIVIENQINNAQKLYKEKIIYEVFSWDDLNQEKIEKAILNRGTTENKISVGTERVIQSLLDEFYLREVQKEDCRKIYKLSNDHLVRKMSINQNKISYKNHVVWFNSNYRDLNNKFYILEDYQKKILGQIRFNIQNLEAVISISLSSKLRGKNKSKEILENAIEKFIKEDKKVQKIIAYIKEENKASLKIFEKNKFKLVKRENELNRYEYFIMRREK